MIGDSDISSEDSAESSSSEDEEETPSMGPASRAGVKGTPGRRRRKDLQEEAVVSRGRASWG